MVGARLLDEPGILIAQPLTHRHHAAVLKQATKERLFSSSRSEVLTQCARRRCRIEAPPPVLDVVKARVPPALQVGDQREAEGEGLNRAESEYKESSSNRADCLRRAIEGGVGSLEDLARQRRVVPQRFGNPIHVGVLLGEADDVEGDGWETRQPWRLKNLVQQALIHSDLSRWSMFRYVRDSSKAIYDVSDLTR